MNFSVKILGNGSALPTSYRNPTAQVVNYNERLFLLDCGEGTQARLRQYQCKFSRIHHIFISHLHGDHYFGLFGLLSSFDLLGRKVPLHIYAPKALKKILGFLQYQAFSYPIQFVDLPHVKKELYADKHLKVYSFPVEHRVECYGFLFEEQGKLPNIRKQAIEDYQLGLAEIQQIKLGSDLHLPDRTVPNLELVHQAPKPKRYVYCADTRPFPALAKIVQGADLLYHETTFLNGLQDLAHKSYHSTTHDASRLATDASVRKLLIGHFSSRVKDDALFLSECRELFAKTEIAKEGEVYDV